MNYQYLKDSSFLSEIDNLKIKEQFVRITALTFAEKPIQAIEGMIISQNLNLDGNSSMRRTCNITMLANQFTNDLTDINTLFSINKKVKVEVGFLNTTNSYTDQDVVWFPLGIYVIISPSINHSTGGATISLQLKDKMCLLNGECGGVIPASTTFHEYETINENGEYVILKPTIYQIIQEVVNHFGGEQLAKIIISDVDLRIKQVMKWTGSSPLYIIQQTKDGDTQYTPTTNELEAISIGTYNVYNTNDDIGYIYTDFTYPSELIGDAGNTVCSILDQIKATLGNFEYFYDVYGNFIFQEIKNYLNTTQATIDLENMDKNNYLIDEAKGKTVYDFNNGNLITSYSNAPQTSMIKNDFIVWGVKENANGNTVPIRYHLAIDKKPVIGNTYDCYFFTDSDGLIKAKTPLKFSSIVEIEKNIGVEGLLYLDTSTQIVYSWDIATKKYTPLDITLRSITTKDWREELYYSGAAVEPLASASNDYYVELNNEFPKLFNLEKGEYFENVIKHPSDIDYYLDMIDVSSSIGQLSVSNIGRRTKVVVDDSVNCIFEPEIPNLILLDLNSATITEEREEAISQGQDFVQLDSNIFDLVSTGGGFNSAYNMIRELLYQHTSYNESISIVTVPLYYLEPNTRISVRDTRSGIYGDYMINSISFSLDTSSTMTISCTRALERL